MLEESTVKRGWCSKVEREVTSELDGPEWSQLQAEMDDIHSTLARRQAHQRSPMMQKK